VAEILADGFRAKKGQKNRDRRNNDTQQQARLTKDTTGDRFSASHCN
jgi:hypothetical protein